MLVLSRKENEVVWIGDDIRVMVIEIRADKVRLGFEAPTDVKVYRDEVFQAIKRGKTK
jgi:carbon storage regulator